MIPLAPFVLFACVAQVDLHLDSADTDPPGSTGSGDSAEPEDHPPEDIDFEEVSGGTGGPAFVLDDELYVIYGALIQRMTEPPDQWETVADTGSDGLNCVEAYNVEVFQGSAWILGGKYRNDDNCDHRENTASAEVWQFDPEAGTAERVASMNFAREVMASAVSGGRLWVLGGWDPQNNPNGANIAEIESFDGESWELVSTDGDWMPVRSPAYAATGGRIYLFGGCADGELTDLACPCTTQTVQILDTETLTFSAGSDMPLSGRHFSGQHAAVRSPYIYVFGGSNDYSCCIWDDVARYDTETDTWTTLTDTLTVERKSVGSAVLGDELWIFGGVKKSEEDQCPGDGSCPEGCGSKGAGTNEKGEFLE